MIQDTVLLNDWHAVALSTEIADNQVKQVRLLGENLVLWRSGGRACVWRDLCVHRGAQLSRGCVKEGHLQCPYHGWTYDASGQCVKMPAHPEQTPPPRAHATAYPVQEAYGLIWTCLGTPAHPLIEFPEYADPSFRKVMCGPYLVMASAPRIIENGLDVAHFAFVHEGILSDPEHAEIRDFRAETNEKGVFAHDIRFWQTDPDGTGKSGEVGYNYWVPRPFTMILRKTSNGPLFSLLQTITPADECRSVFYSCVAMNYAHDTPDEAIRGFQDRVFAQDIPVIESQRPELLPLDLQAELHLRADRTSIAYRQWLTKLGLTFGTA